MSDYQEKSYHSDPNSPVNQPDWDGEWDCPECGDHCSNAFKEDEPIKDCLDHIEDGDLRHYIRLERAKHEGQIIALNTVIAKKDGQLNDLLDAVRFLKTCLDEKAANGPETGKA